MNDEGAVLVHAQHLVEKRRTGVFLFAQNAPLAHAGVNQHSQSERQVGLMREVADRLRPVVFLNFEIILSQAADDVTLLVADGGEHIDNLDVHGDRRRLGLRACRRRLLPAQRFVAGGK